MWRGYTRVIHCVFDQIPNLQNCFTKPDKNLGVEGVSDRYTPAAMSLYRSIFKKSVHLGLESLVIWSMTDTFFASHLLDP